MTPPFQPGDRVTVRHNKPLGVLTVRDCVPYVDQKTNPRTGWYCVCQGDGCKFSGPATSLIKVKDESHARQP